MEQPNGSNRMIADLYEIKNEVSRAAIRYLWPKDSMLAIALCNWLESGEKDANAGYQIDLMVDNKASEFMIDVLTSRKADDYEKALLTVYEKWQPEMLLLNITRLNHSKLLPRQQVLVILQFLSNWKPQTYKSTYGLTAIIKLK